jgi:hypothetical protein
VRQHKQLRELDRQPRLVQPVAHRTELALHLRVHGLAGLAVELGELPCCGLHLTSLDLELQHVTGLVDDDDIHLAVAHRVAHHVAPVHAVKERVGTRQRVLQGAQHLQFSVVTGAQGATWGECGVEVRH